ncbi:MAG: hypothetical protein VKP70_11255 [Cyanobacteriota bacterium]|nr:hypothetical protein [Cyanobacteriota bacterium]
MGGHQLVAGLGLLVVVLATGGCAGTPWGDTLSGSFPAPGAADSRDPAPLPQAGSPPSAPQDSSAPQERKPPAPAVSPPAPSRPPASKGGQAPPAAPRQAPPASSPSASSPYRVTLRLPLADPSAPAEAVTQALRGAGIVFEVETIERVNGGAPAPPAVRPAPPPR